MTPEQAAQQVRLATDANGLKVVLLTEADMFRVEKIRQRVFEMAQSFAPDTAFMQPNGEYVAALNLCYLARLLAETLKDQ